MDLQPKKNIISSSDLKQNFIVLNPTQEGRNKDSKYFCCLCEQYIKSKEHAVEHIRTFNHKCYAWRHEDRSHLCDSWRKYPPTKSRNLKFFIQSVEKDVDFQNGQLYSKNLGIEIDKMMADCRIFIKDYKIEFAYFGSHVSRLLTTENPVVDCFVSIEKTNSADSISNFEKFNVLMKRLPAFSKFNDFNGPFYGKIAECSKFSKIKFFFTVDSKAWNAVLSSRLIALYMHFCPSVFRLAHVLRKWGQHIGLLQASKDFRVSSSIFDYMTIYFFQRYYDLPIINEDKVGCPLSDFLQKDLEEQLTLLDPILGQYSNRYLSLGTDILFMNWILFYATGVTYTSLIQIDSEKEIHKVNEGIRTINIIDPIAKVNIFRMRTEHLIHFENMIIFGATDFLSPFSDSNFVNKLIAVDISTNAIRNVRYPFLIFDRDSEQLKTKSYTKVDLNGLAIFSPDAIKRPIVFCHFCHERAHTVQECRHLSLKVVKEVAINPQLTQQLSKFISNYHDTNRIRMEDHNKAAEIINELQSIIISRIGYMVELHQFGSFKSGFGSRTSDFDLCITNSNKDKEPQQLLQEVEKALKSAEIDVKPIFAARVPILRIHITRDKVTYKGDICCSNELALHNTQLLASYAAFDERVAPFVMIIKKWANASQINSAAEHTFSSYALSVMSISFLQRVEPPVLPYLQDAIEFKLEPKIFDDIHEIHFATPDKKYQKKFRKNSMSLGELFAKFFDYYSKFDFKTQVVQIRKQENVLKMDKEWFKSEICVEDPFDLSHNLTAGIRLSNSLVIYKFINITQVELSKKNSVFLRNDFDFDSEHYKSIVKVLNNHNKNACHKCGQTGHIKANCPMMAVNKEKSSVSD